MWLSGCAGEHREGLLGMCVSRAHLGPLLYNENTDSHPAGWYLRLVGGFHAGRIGVGQSGTEAANDRDLGVQGLSSWAPSWAFPYHFSALCFLLFVFLFF